jgi:hypothetical protein
MDQGFLNQKSACKTEKLLLHATTDQGDTAEAKKGSQSWLWNCGGIRGEQSKG